MSVSMLLRALRSCLLAVGFSCSLAWTAVTAQEPAPALQLKRLTLEELGEIVVTTVTKSSEQVWRTDAAIHVITNDDIRRSGATSIPEALRLAPGVQVARIDTSRWAVGIRGFASQFSQSLLVLVDGRSVYTPMFAGVYWAIQDLLLEDVDRIEVIRGPGGTIWGTNAVNGVINIITKPAVETQGIFAAVSGGNVDRVVGEFRYGGRARDDLHYRVSARAFDRGPQHHPGFGSFDDWSMGEASMRADWKPSGGDTLTVLARAYNGSEGKLTGIATYVPPAQTTVDAPDDVSGGHLLAQWRRTFGAGRELRFQGSYDRTNRSGAQFGETRDTMDLDFAHQQPLGRRHTLRWGAGARWSPSTFEQTIDTLDFQPREQTHRVYSLFAQDEVAIASRRGHLTGGLKFEHNEHTGWEVQPTGRFLWAFSTRNTAWAAVTRAVRIPSRLDRDIELNGNLNPAPATYLRIAGSPDFDAERTLAYEAGYRQLFSDKVFVDVAAFHNRYSDLNGIGAATVFAETDPIPHTVVQVQFANAVEGTTTGFEISPSWALAPWWTVRGAYSFLALDLRNMPGFNNPANVQTQEDSSPRHQVYVQSVLSVARRLEFQQTFRAVSALSGQQVPAYQALDLTGIGQLARNIELSAGVHNLLDANHPEFGGTPGGVGIRRSFYVRLTWRR
jgi:iron complex outermembrane receptor protein